MNHPQRTPSTRLRDPRTLRNLRAVECLVRGVLGFIFTPEGEKEPWPADLRNLHYLSRSPGAVRLRLNRKARLPIESIRLASERLERRDRQRNR